jgi:BNR repeat-like domain
MIHLILGITLAFQLGPIAPDVPSREPQMATNGSTVVLAFGAGKGIYVSTSADSGAHFGAPLKVAEAAVVPLTRHRGPRVVFAGQAIVITAVAGKTEATGQHAHGLPTDGDLVSWRSVNGGKTWSHGVVVNDAPGGPTEGLHSLAADSKGNLFAAWLDKRSGHGTELYGARSNDGGLTWSKNVMIFHSPEDTICECCHPSAAIDPRGQILVMYRNWLKGSRDMYLTRSADGVHFSKPEKLGNGTWPLNACPMDGGGLAVSNDRIVTAWRRDETVFLAAPGRAETPVGDGKDVALAVAGDKTYVSRTHGTAIEVWVNGKVEVLAKEGAFSSLASLPQGGVLAAWEENGGIRIRRLP